ncbi:MAG: hypothetical protein KBA26_08595 [Candidatus Delongbacteria bacterium]|nr:hypothetical protein [Candidatus Delongbacteria bacterium]
MINGCCDLRGSWPYQDFPSTSEIDAFLQNSTSQPLTWTGIIAPNKYDIKRAKDLLSTYNGRIINLKTHLAHIYGKPAVWTSYSRRTRNRITEAESKYSVHEESFTADLVQLSERLQADLIRYKSIPHISLPDSDHFQAIANPDVIPPHRQRCMILRNKINNNSEGLILLLQDSDENIWHMHSFLVGSQARKDFGSMLLFHAAVEQWGSKGEIWFGGQPSCTENNGIFTFKSRFSNHQAPAYLLCLDLQPEKLDSIRKQYPVYNWLPDYRNPEDELKRLIVR